MCIDDWVYFLRCRANSRKCLRRCLAFGYVARCCSRRNARLSCGADNGGRNTFPHTISPFTPFNSVLLRSGASRFLKPNCVAWLLSNNRKRLLHTSFKVLQQPRFHAFFRIISPFRNKAKKKKIQRRLHRRKQQRATYPYSKTKHKSIPLFLKG